MAWAGVLWATLGLLASGCTEAPDPAILRMGLATMPVNLDPRHATDAASNRVNRLLYRRLVELDAADRPIPGLVDWHRLAPTHYRLRLRPDPQGRTFSDGRPLTSEDVRATLASILDPATGSPYRTQLALISHLQIVDPEHLDIRLSRPDPLLPTHLVIEILPAELVAAGHPFQHRPVGSGPFQLFDWPQPGRLQLYRRSDGQMVELLEVKDPGVRVMKLLRGEIDLLQSDLPPELFRFLRSRPRVRVMGRPGHNFTYIGLNLRDPALAQLSVRQAIAHAIDPDAIIRYVLGGAARPAQALLPPHHWAGVPDLPPYVPDAERARHLLAMSGYGPDHPLEIEYKTSSDPFRVRLATIIQAQLEAVGIRTRVHSLDWGTFYGDIKAGRFQLYSLTWVGVKTPDQFRAIFHSTSVPPAGANRGHYQNTRVDALIEQAEQQPDLEGQARVYRALQRVLLEDLPYIPLWYEDQIAAMGLDVRGYTPAADGNFDALVQTTRTVRSHTE